MINKNALTEARSTYKPKLPASLAGNSPTRSATLAAGGDDAIRALFPMTFL